MTLFEQLALIDYALQVAAILLLLYGLYQMGNVRKRGPAFAALSEVLWVGVGIMHHVPGLILLSVILTLIQFRAWLKWQRSGKPW